MDYLQLVEPNENTNNTANNLLGMLAGHRTKQFMYIELILSATQICSHVDPHFTDEEAEVQKC